MPKSPVGRFNEEEFGSGSPPHNATPGRGSDNVLISNLLKIS
jgi:hypothetical protein